jgi:hypothetical protein
MEESHLPYETECTQANTGLHGGQPAWSFLPAPEQYRRTAQSNTRMSQCCLHRQ